MKYKSIQEIEALTLDDVIIEVFRRLVDTSSVPIGTLFYEYSANESLEPYYRIELHESIEKPSLAEVEAEFIVYKQELLDKFEPAVAAKSRLDALTDLRILMSRIGRNEPNMKLFVKRIIEENDVDLISELEAENEIYVPEKISMEEIEEDIVLGTRAKNICNDCLHVVRGHNSKANLTKPEIRAMKQSFADILEDLRDGSPISAKEGIAGVNDPNFAELKEKLLKVLAKNGIV